MTAPVYIPPPEAVQAGATTVGRLFAETTALNPGRTALVEGDRELTYGELDARVNRLAGAMLEREVGRGDRVALLARNCIAFLEVELAAAKIGAITVSFNWRWAEAEIAHCLRLTSPRLVVAAPEYATALRAAARPPDLSFGAEYEVRFRLSGTANRMSASRRRMGW